MTDSEPGDVKPSQSAERRRGDRRGGDDRRKQEPVPPEGIERRKGERRTIDRRRFLQGVAAGLGALAVGSPFTDTVIGERAVGLAAGSPFTDTVMGERASLTAALSTITALTYPVTVTPPSYYVWLRSITRNGGAFYTNETARVLNTVPPALSNWISTTTKAFTGNFYIRNYYGTLIANGSVRNATAIPIPNNLPCGGYRIYLTQSVNDPNYGYSAGAGCFLIVNPDRHFPSLAGVPLGTFNPGGDGDCILMHGFTLQGPTRLENDDPTKNGFLANQEQGANWLNEYYTPIPDSNRPRPLIASWIDLVPAGTAISDMQSVITTLYDNCGVQWFEGPANEPTGTAATIASELQTLSAKIKAVVPKAKVMGPCPVQFNNGWALPGGYLYNQLHDLAAMDPVPIDGISFHSYNCHNGDLLLGHICYQQLANDISAAGLSGLPLFDTEQGFFAMNYGVFEPRLQGRWTMQMFLLEEQFGIPKEHHIIFYDSVVPGQTGTAGFPSNYSTRNTWFPAVAMMRAFSAEVWGMPGPPNGP